MWRLAMDEGMEVKHEFTTSVRRVGDGDGGWRMAIAKGGRKKARWCGVSGLSGRPLRGGDGKGRTEKVWDGGRGHGKLSRSGMGSSACCGWMLGTGCRKGSRVKGGVKERCRKKIQLLLLRSKACDEFGDRGLCDRRWGDSGGC